MEERGWKRVVAKVKRERVEHLTREEESPVEATPAEESPSDRAANRTATATVWIAIFTVILALVGSFTLYEVIAGGVDTRNLAIAAGNQAAAAQKFADTAVLINGGIGNAVQRLQDQVNQQQGSLRMVQRPWLRFELGGERPKEADPTNAKWRIIPTIAGQPLKVEMLVTNVGKTTAERIFGFVLVQVTPKDKNPFFPAKRLMFTEDGKPTPKGRTFRTTAWMEGPIYPDETSQEEFYRMDEQVNERIALLTGDEKSDLDARKDYILVMGQVWYSDVFGVRHWTRFCQMTNPDINILVARQCAAFGEVDANQANDEKKPNKR